MAHLANRTSSPLESINSILNRSIAKKTHFFRFVARLRFFESQKAHEMDLASRNQLKECPPRDKRTAFRNKKIEEITEMFDKGRIDVQEFLKAMASNENGM